MAAGGILATCVLLGEWGTRVVAAIQNGITDADSIRYHLPFSASFFQTAQVTGYHYTENDPTLVFQPDTSELLHALGMSFLGNDALSTVMNFAWLAVALLAGYVVGGRRWGWLVIAAIIALLSWPLMAIQAGSAGTDIVGLATRSQIGRAHV